MTDKLDETWTRREFPLLREAARQLDSGQALYVHVDALAAQLNFDPAQAQIAVDALYADGYLDGIHVEEVQGPVIIHSISGRARRELGLWPSPETGVDRLVAAIGVLAEQASDEDERTRLQKIRDHVTDNGAKVGWALVTAILTGQLPGQ